MCDSEQCACWSVCPRWGGPGWALGLERAGPGRAREPHPPSSPRCPGPGSGLREPQGPEVRGGCTGPRSRVEAACGLQGRAAHVTHPHSNPGTASHVCQPGNGSRQGGLPKDAPQGEASRGLLSCRAWGSFPGCPGAWKWGARRMGPRNYVSPPARGRTSSPGPSAFPWTTLDVFPQSREASLLPSPVLREAWGWGDGCWRSRSFSARVGCGARTPEVAVGVCRAGSREPRPSSGSVPLGRSE